MNETTKNEDENEDEDSDKGYKEENEYDFANSLLTVDYKPYNQYSSSIEPEYGSRYLNSSKKREWNIADKLVQISEFNFEETLRQMLTNFGSFFPHVLYSLLKGRPVICVTRYCNNVPYLNSIVDCLSNFIPNSNHCLNDSNSTQPKFTSSPCQHSDPTHKQLKSVLKSIFERRTIKLNDLKYCKLFGLNLLISKDGCCSSDCSSAGTTNVEITNQIDCRYKHQHKHYHFNKSQDDSDLLLKYIPITIQNYVSVLDLDKLTFTGPAYKGTYLTHCVQKCKQLQQDSICYLYLLSRLVKHYVRVSFLFNYSLVFNESENSGRRMSLSSGNKEAKGGQQRARPAANSRRERILKYFQSSTQLFNNSDIKLNRKPSYYSSISSSISSLASSLIGLNNNNFQRKSSLSTLNQNDDYEMLKMIVAYSNSSLNPDKSLNYQLNPVIYFDLCDFNIVTFIIKTLRVKQIYLYNMALRKRKMGKLEGEMRSINVLDNEIENDEMHGESTEMGFNETQMPLLIDYEEITCFIAKK